MHNQLEQKVVSGGTFNLCTCNIHNCYNIEVNGMGDKLTYMSISLHIIWNDKLLTIHKLW